MKNYHKKLVVRKTALFGFNALTTSMRSTLLPKETEFLVRVDNLVHQLLDMEIPYCAIMDKYMEKKNG